MKQILKREPGTSKDMKYYPFIWNSIHSLLYNSKIPKIAFCLASTLATFNRAFFMINENKVNWLGSRPIDKLVEAYNSLKAVHKLFYAATTVVLDETTNLGKDYGKGGLLDLCSSILPLSELFLKEIVKLYQANKIPIINQIGPKMAKSIAKFSVNFSKAVQKVPNRFDSNLALQILEREARGFPDLDDDIFNGFSLMCFEIYNIHIKNMPSCSLTDEQIDLYWQFSEKIYAYGNFERIIEKPVREFVLFVFQNLRDKESQLIKAKSWIEQITKLISDHITKFVTLTRIEQSDVDDFGILFKIEYDFIERLCQMMEMPKIKPSVSENDMAVVASSLQSFNKLDLAVNITQLFSL